MADRIVRTVLLAVFLLSPLGALGADSLGAHDPSFGDEGVATLSFTGAFTGFLGGGAVMPDGRLVVVGNMTAGESATTNSLVARFTADGQPDVSLGGSGVGVLPVRPEDRDSGKAVVVQPDGKMLILGEWGHAAGFYVARLGVDGIVDPEFGEGGVVSFTRHPSINAAKTIALQPDGKILVAGGDWPAFGLMRLQADGSLDPTFGDGGHVNTFIGDRADIDAIALLPDGRILAAGDTDDGRDEHNSLAVARYMPDGTLDPSFGNAGITTFGDDTADIFVWDAAVQSDGRLVIAAGVETRDGTDLTSEALFRLTTDGTLDPTFALQGLFLRLRPTGWGGFWTVAVLADDSIVAGGFRNTVLFDANGALVEAYGDMGTLPLRLSVRDIVPLPDGRVIFLGHDVDIDEDQWRAERITTGILVAPPRGQLGNPAHDSDQSGVGVFSGWTCADGKVIIVVDGKWFIEPGSGTSRGDTEGACGDIDNGFGYLINWPLLGEGEHEAVVYVDGLELDRATFRVTTLGANFIRGASGEVQLRDFPRDGNDITLTWEESSQSFRITGAQQLLRNPEEVAPALALPDANFENPKHGSYQSGVALISGWVCEADEVTIAVDDEHFFTAASGTSRGDTLDVCGDIDNGFSYLVNMNLFGDGQHEAVVYADGEEIGRSTFYVTTLGENFLRDVEGHVFVHDFEGMYLTLEWSQPLQNFVVTNAADEVP